VPLKETHLEIPMPSIFYDNNYRTPGANVGLGKLPLWTLRLADYVMMSPALFNHLHQRGVYTYLWVLGRGVCQGIQPRRYWRDDRLPFTTSKFSGQERQIIISPSAFTVMKPKSKKLELIEEIVSLRKPFPAAFNSFRCEFYLDVVRCHPEM